MPHAEPTLTPLTPPPTCGLAALLEVPQFVRYTGCIQRDYAAGEVIVRDGDATTSVYLILSGMVRIEGTVRLQSGRQFQAGVTELTTGAILGELALFDREPHSGTVIADTRVRLAIIESAPLLDYLNQHPAVGYQVLKDLLQQMTPRFRKTTARVYRFLAWGLKAYHLDE